MTKEHDEGINNIEGYCMSDNTMAETISPDQALDSFSANKMKDAVRLTAWAYEHVFIQGRSSSHQPGRVVIGWACRSTLSSGAVTRCVSHAIL